MALPPEVLDTIFELVAFESPRQPEAMLFPLLRVCRTWYPVAERRLYRSISIGEDTSMYTKNRGWFMVNTGKRIARKLIETLENPRLAALVHELSLATSYFRDDRILTGFYIKLISMCPKLAHIRINGFSKDLRDELKEELTGKKNLISLRISKYSREGGQNDFFCDTVELIGMMAHWPRLEIVSFGGDTLCGSGYSEPFPAPSGVLCPQLRRYFISSASLNERDMDALQIITGRRLEAFIADIEDTEQARVALLRCLAAWASCLESVLLDVSYGSKIAEPDRSIAIAFSILPSLKVLKLETGCMRPATLLELPALEVLEYIILPTDHIEVPQALVSGLEVSGTKSDVCRLPMLRSITLRFLYNSRSSDKVNKASLKRLYEVCATRNIKLYCY
ncbi:hypothetical protein DFH11DRAFT_1744725 [Phellopilus nigrolimitatus]|nr:hypothetical protein DFH11DRAFT_1744725 [Phellopilus nigrolimitatus]